MSKQQQTISLFDPSLNYFCNLCHKSLKGSARIIAKLNDEIQTYFVNLCPPCLANQRYVTRISQYFVYKKVCRPLERYTKITASQALQTIHVIQKEGIEQMFLRCLDSSDKLFQMYKELNRQVFKSEELQIKVNFEDNKIPIAGIQREKPNPPNRKHLKALGYNWERQEFTFQPEIIFGYLMGYLEQQQQQTQEDIQLRNIIFSYYEKQMQAVNEVNQFIVNSPFLLGRKAIQDLQQVPKQINDLRNIEAEIKELVAAICNLTVEEKAIQNKYQGQQIQKDGKKHKQKKHHRQKDVNQSTRDSEGQNKDDKSRTRDKKQRKRTKIFSSSQQGSSTPRHQPSIPSPPQQLTQKTQDKSSLSYTQSLSDSTEGKRKRGRPKGSKSKVKVMRRKRKDRIFELKMDIDHKISSKRERLDKKREQKENDRKRQADNHYQSVSLVYYSKDGFRKFGDHVMLFNGKVPQPTSKIIPT